MPVATFVSVNEYLRTAYRPDCDYFDGVVLEGNLGGVSTLEDSSPDRRFFMAGMMGTN